MPFVKPNEPLAPSPAILFLFGAPGVRKTSIGHTFEKSLVIDFDRGVKRSYGRGDVLTVDSWQEVADIQNRGELNGFRTVVIDTAKAALDDFLMVHVIQQDYNLARNKLRAFGAVGDAFKLFVNNLRAANIDLVFIAHSKTDDDKHIMPDVSGQSSGLLLRIADQVGYVRMINNVPSISFQPTDLITGKDCAGLGTVIVPDKADAAWPTFGADMMTRVKESISSMNEAQRKALEASKGYQEALSKVETPAALTALFVEVANLPEYLKAPMVSAIKARAKEYGWVANKETKQYEAAPDKATEAAPAAPAEEVKPEQAAPAAPEAAKPKAATKAAAPAGPSAPAAEEVKPEHLPTAWFTERTGQRIFSDGSKVKPHFNPYTGIYWLENAGFAPYCSGELQQKQGYTFRDLTPEEVAKLSPSNEAE